MKRANKFSQLFRFTLLNTVLFFILYMSLTVQDAESRIVKRKGFHHRHVRDTDSETGNTKPDGGDGTKSNETPTSEKEDQPGVEKPIITGGPGAEGDSKTGNGTKTGNETASGEKPEDFEREKSSDEKQNEEEANNSQEVRNKLNFNDEDRPPWATAFVNHSVVEQKCNESNPCLASNLVLPVCGKDGESYLNPGVFRCAQKCDPDLAIFQTGACAKYVMPPMPPSTTMPPPTTPPPKHETPKTRLRVRGILIQPLLRLIGLHVHDDGGFYLTDEKKHEAWWNS